MAKDPLKILLEHANTKLDGAGVRLGELLASEAMAGKRLELLETYRKEYRDRFMETARSGIGPDAWKNFSSFLAKLDDAIAHQQSLVAQSRRQTADGQAQWVHERNRVKAFDALSHRQAALVTRRENQQEQKASDDRSMNRHVKDGSEEE
jgi:flagellar protein FliJ